MPSPPSPPQGKPEPSRSLADRRVVRRVLSNRELILMMDVLFLALTAVLFSLTWGLVRLCDSV
jgi:hypothetical protein